MKNAYSRNGRGFLSQVPFKGNCCLKKASSSSPGIVVVAKRASLPGLAVYTSALTLHFQIPHGNDALVEVRNQLGDTGLTKVVKKSWQASSLQVL